MSLSARPVDGQTVTQTANLAPSEPPPPCKISGSSTVVYRRGTAPSEFPGRSIVFRSKTSFLEIKGSAPFPISPKFMPIKPNQAPTCYSLHQSRTGSV